MTRTNDQASGRASRIRYRILVVALSVVAACTVWLVATLVGVPLRVRSPLIGPVVVDLPSVVAGALLGGLAGWGALALLERVTARPRRVWTLLAVVILAGSLTAVALLDAAIPTKVALGLMHLATGVPLVLLLPRRIRADRN